jgi:hypothetical protein
VHFVDDMSVAELEFEFDETSGVLTVKAPFDSGPAPELDDLVSELAATLDFTAPDVPKEKSDDDDEVDIDALLAGIGGDDDDDGDDVDIDALLAGVSDVKVSSNAHLGGPIKGSLGKRRELSQFLVATFNAEVATRLGGASLDVDVDSFKSDNGGGAINLLQIAATREAIYSSVSAHPPLVGNVKVCLFVYICVF